MPPKRVKPRRGPARSDDYLRFVRSLGCAGPGAPEGCWGSVQAHHAGARGLGMKASDFTAIPLCLRHHGAWHDCGGAFGGWDKATRLAWATAVIAETQRLYRERGE